MTTLRVREHRVVELRFTRFLAQMDQSILLEVDHQMSTMAGSTPEVPVVVP
jgi:hypothetical protein